MHDMKFRGFSSLRMKILTLVEFGIEAGSLLLAIILLHVQVPLLEFEVVNLSLVYATIFALITQLFSLSLGLYNPKSREPYRAVVRRVILAIAMGGFTLMLGTLMFATVTLSPEAVLLAMIVSMCLVCLVRYADFHSKFLTSRKINVLVIGAGKRASIIEQRMKRHVDRKRFNLHGFVVMRGDSPDGIQKERKFTLEGQNLSEYILKNDIDELVIACDERRNNLPIGLLFECKMRGTSVIEIVDFIEREIGQVAANLIHPSWVIYSNGFTSPNDLRNALDRLFNAVIAAVLLLVTSPFMLGAWLAIKLEDGLRAPVLYIQERVGLNGKVFNIIKFRSMCENAEPGQPVWAERNDPRTTRVGEYLRKYRIDELPQLWNVLRGDMGLVGPRPERPHFVKDLIEKIPYYNQRHNVKPGLAGWAQLRYPYGSSNEDALEKLKFDLYYVKHRSFLLDLHILVQTVEVVLFGKGR